MQNQRKSDPKIKYNYIKAFIEVKLKSLFFSLQFASSLIPPLVTVLINGWPSDPNPSHTTVFGFGSSAGLCGGFAGVP